MSEYTQGICQDGAAILKDGQMMTIEEIINDLKATDEQQKQIDALKSAMSLMRDDLLRRADIDPDGTRAVNVSSSVWSKFCDVLDSEQGKKGEE